MGCEPHIRVQAEDFDLAVEIDRLTDGRRDVGAVVTFTGKCRDEGGRLAALELEHYPGMAEAEMTRIARQAAERWQLSGLTVVHRYGKIRPGENIVLVVTASSHRKAALEAADFLMDYLKSRAPFWKKEHLTDAGPGQWVEAKAEDENALERWKK
ncbi:MULTISPECIES: molybdenum cofactor biosynthesis protein MoaE [Chelativorans]|jgi:molybdopterin synthase catalytic subunit|uniref:Molybdopterin synthase catalytic subunit n=1 Tax=Chelativorans sp. (strain BNC1) TaxID=266779 RepID=Q11GV4_CHESB|nr:MULTISPECIES: molybdenum cofactor biosynthesis protein MoaE [Chelativorans]